MSRVNARLPQPENFYAGGCGFDSRLATKTKYLLRYIQPIRRHPYADVTPPAENTTRSAEVREWSGSSLMENNN
jgi:hypothetical protein